MHLSIFVSVISQLDAKNFYFAVSLFHASIFFVHVLIIRRSKLYYTASGIVTPIGGRLVHSALCTGEYRYSCTVQALRFCTGRTANRGSRGIAVLYRHCGSVQAVRPIGGLEV